MTDSKQYFGMSADDGFVLTRTTSDDYPFISDERRMTHHRYNQTYKGVKVEYAELFLHHKNDRIEFINCKLAENLNLSVTPTLTEIQGLTSAINYLGANHIYSWQDSLYEEGYKEEREDSNATSYPQGELLIVKKTETTNFAPDQFVLAWKYSILALDTPINLSIYIDANTGAYIKHQDNMRNGTTNLSYNYGNGAYIDTWWRSGTYQHHVLRCDDANGPKIWTKRAQYFTSNYNTGGAVKSFGGFNCTIYPWNPNKDCTENTFDADDNWTDDVVSTPHWAAMKAWDYYKTKLNRNSYDGKGSEIKILADITQWANYIPFNTVFWNDKDNVLWIGKHTNGKHYGTRDVVGHELTHGVTKNTANFGYVYESGALDESFADIFGYMVERYANGGVHANWDIGEDVEIERRMNNPSQSKQYTCEGMLYAQPSIYKGNNWYITTSWQKCDYGGVHINSGVQNYWFYLLSEGSAGAPDGTYQNIQVNGIGADKASQIAYYNLDNFLGSASQYKDSRNGSILGALIMYGICSEEYKQTQAAWAAVGIGQSLTPLTLTGAKFILYCTSDGVVTIKNGMPITWAATGGNVKQYSWSCSAPWAWVTANSSAYIANDLFSVTNFNNNLTTGVISVTDGCATVSKQISFIDYCAPIQQVSIIVAPNPTLGMMVINGDFDDTESPVVVVITNMNGNILFDSEYGNLPINISLPDQIIPGNYYVKVIRGEQMGQAQFIRQSPQ